jgi:hypothetical protein
MILATPPTLEEVRDRLKVPAAVVDDAHLQDILDAEQSDQQAVCRTDPYPAQLRSALFRRCARAIAAEGVPLGILADEFGQTSLRANDAEITRLEGPFSPLRLGTGGTALQVNPL